MTNDFGERDALAEALARYTQLTLRETQADGTSKQVRPSFREIERRTGIPHQRLSDFLRNPQGATAEMAGRIARAIDNPQASVVFQGTAVTYVNAPRFTRDVLANLTIPTNATAVRFVVRSTEVGYKGFRSSEWAGDLDALAELGQFVPGGYDNIERLVFDVAD